MTLFLPFIRFLLINAFLINTIPLSRCSLQITLTSEETIVKKAISQIFAPSRLASAITTSVLCAVLFVCANTNSCAMVHQPEMPADAARFSKIK